MVAGAPVQVRVKFVSQSIRSMDATPQLFHGSLFPEILPVRCQCLRSWNQRYACFPLRRAADMQGFKVVIRDIGLHMSNRVMDYCSEDAGLCRGALDTQRRQDLPFSRTGLSSVQEFLEMSHFVQASLYRAIKLVFYSVRAHCAKPGKMAARRSSSMCDRREKYCLMRGAVSRVVCSLPDRHAQLSGRVPSNPFTSRGASRRIHCS